jgi:hypothetical protein
MRFRATSPSGGIVAPVVGARIRFAGRTLVTGPRGRAAEWRLFRRPARRFAAAAKRGYHRGSAAVVVRPPL